MRTCAMIVVSLAMLGADAPADAEKEVLARLNKLNDAFVKKDADSMRQLMTEDHVGILASGVRQSREEHLKGLVDLKLSEYTMADVKTTMPAKNMVVVSYRATQKGSFKGAELPAKIMVASVWVNQNGKWLEVLYQETALTK